MGSFESRTVMQHYCVRNQSGLLTSQVNDWLWQNARRPDEIDLHSYQWTTMYPREYIIHNNFKYKRGGRHPDIGAIGAEIANKLLARGEQVAGGWSRKNSMGHAFNMAKNTKSDTIWYVDAQYKINPGKQSLVNAVRESGDIANISFILAPWQAALLVDEDGQPMLFESPT